MTTIREGDIEALRRKMKNEGRPIKSNIIRDGDSQIHYDTDKKGKVKIIDKT